MTPQHAPADHDAILQLLPWWRNGTLDADDARRVAAHLDGCERCRSEAGQDAALARRLAAARVPSGDPAPALAQLLARIDAEAAPAPRAAAAAPRPAALRRPWYAHPGDWRLLLGGLGGAATAALALLLAMADPPAATPDATTPFHTLSSTAPDAAPPAAGFTLRVIFADDVDPTQAAAILRGLDARTVAAAPSAPTVHRIWDGTWDGLAARDAALAVLRARADVRFAEPGAAPASAPGATHPARVE